MNRKEFKEICSNAVDDPKYQGKVIQVNLDSQVRCPHCNRMFFKGDFLGAIEIKCPDCKQIVSLRQL